VFEFGDRELTPVDTLPGFENAGEKLKVSGTIFRPDGRTPAEDVILYIYHTNEAGVYETRGDESGWARRHGFIRGWIKTVADGRYTFYTRMPGSYASNPAHIHPLILEPDGRYYYISEYLFRGDPNLPNEESDGRGGSGIVALTTEGDMLVAGRNIVLGRGVPGY
jgi:protocatechuate 3,4-dioxygenase beta subunit